ncbi:MAG: hypothetical protein C4525_01380 [Desulfarculus sp.]|jgi:hypothetical protein|nr:MAG: hypothetical protein C4525_01380 [Desulfarculus sp.]
MSALKSVTKYERQILPAFRNKINAAESTEDVRKEFHHSAKDLILAAAGGDLTIYTEDIVFDPAAPPYYRLSPELHRQGRFQALWKSSDLPRVLQDLAELARHRYKHLDKNPDKTEATMHKSGRGRGRPSRV